ncbi:GntR family transcriptional regulator [Paenibacillus sp. 598K]|uniref:GntR family transcriptional regulator n=1 Tax=Paenibacillus sp. 598K TaxID=1117987 RepID=UPI000FFE4226|nr:GntR family transcriptional regulator [Paenibacillus sp. 598K]
MSTPTKYQVIVNDIKAKIDSGEWQPDTQIPSQTELAQLYDTSEMTSRRALSELVNEGRIYRLRGKGSFVRGERAADPAEVKATRGPAAARALNTNGLEKLYLVHNTGAQILYLEHRFYDDMFGAIREESGRRGIAVEWWDYSLHGKLPDTPNAGFIVTTMGEREFSSGQIEQWMQEGRHLVTVHSYFPQFSVPYVIIDNLTGGYLATHHLLELGHRRIGILLTGASLVDLNQEFSLRLQGYKLALNLAHLPLDPELVHVVNDDTESQQSGELGYRYFEQLAEPPTAIFAASDLKAYGLARAAQQRGLSVPEDLSIVGYDDMRFAQYVGLTTINQNSALMGKRAVEILCSDNAAKRGSASLKDEIVPQLVVRQSTAACRSAISSP